LRSQQDIELFPLEQVRAGLKGIGRTVFEGDKVEEFEVEILGVLRNATGPKHNVILARLAGGPLECTGLIAGMSGSPVYVDGKLVGAIALSFPFSKEPITGITPIEEMLQVVPEGQSRTQATSSIVSTFRIARSISGDTVGRLIPDPEAGLLEPSRLLQAGHEAPAFTEFRLPLRFGGFPQEVIEAYAPLFRSMGFEPMQGGVLAGSAQEPSWSTELVPGSMISLMLVRGDLNLNVDCTVTYRRGNQIYACGHRVLMAGPAQIPFAASRVLATVPSLASSFKINAPGAPVGTINQDRFSAIHGVLGVETPLIPVHIEVNSSLNKKADYHLEIVQEPFLSPLLLNLVIPSVLSVTERALGPSTLELKGKIRLSGGESVSIEDVVAGDTGMANAAGLTLSTPLSYILASDFRDVRIEGIDLAIIARSERRVATLEQVWASKSEVKPGDRVELTALLRTPSGESLVERILVDVPESVTDRMLSLVVGSGSSINALEFRLSPLSTTPRDLRQLVRALNRVRSNNRLYALLLAPQRSFVLQGEEYPSPPPSLVQTLLADPAVASTVMMVGNSVIGDFETKACAHTIRGQKTLILKVSQTGS